jgi:hypothetical protein
VKLAAARHGAPRPITVSGYVVLTAWWALVGIVRTAGRLLAWWHGPGLAKRERRAAAGLVGLLMFCVRRTLADAARVLPPHPGAVSSLHGTARAAPPFPQRRELEPPAMRPEIHIHVAATQEAAALLSMIGHVPEERP